VKTLKALHPESFSKLRIKENRYSDSRTFLTLLHSHSRAGDFPNAGKIYLVEIKKVGFECRHLLISIKKMLKSECPASKSI